MKDNWSKRFAVIRKDFNLSNQLPIRKQYFLRMNYLNSIVSVMIHLELKFRGSGNICNVSLKKSQTE